MQYHRSIIQWTIVPNRGAQRSNPSVHREEARRSNTIYSQQLARVLEYRSWPQILAALQVNGFGHRAHQQAPFEESLGYYPRVWWLEKHYWADSERALWAVVVCFEVTICELLCLTACAMWSRGSWLGDPWFPHGAFVASLTSWYGLVTLMFFPFVSAAIPCQDDTMLSLLH